MPKEDDNTFLTECFEALCDLMRAIGREEFYNFVHPELLNPVLGQQGVYVEELSPGEWCISFSDDEHIKLAQDKKEAYQEAIEFAAKRRLNE